LQLAAVADPDPAARAAIAGGRVPAFASLDELLAARLPLHAALVLTPPHLHEPQAARLLAAGLHVLCEKPLVPTAAAAERLFAIKDHLSNYNVKGEHATVVLTADQVAEAILAHRATEKLKVKNLLVAKPKPEAEVQRPGQRQRRPMPARKRKV
ncbi:MAG: Gfo/Idh/MocA family oxidoreductase, partial [Anaerolineae bacterium]|nr:Gfo/Idh/MocA family oxidoreductase [Anaerolineae bacterium]